MKTILKVALLLLLVFLVIKLLPFAALPTGCALAVLGVLGVGILAVVFALGSGLIGLALGLLALALVLVLLLSPLWLPVLAVFGLVWLVRKLSSKSSAKV